MPLRRRGASLVDISIGEPRRAGTAVTNPSSDWSRGARRAACRRSSGCSRASRSWSRTEPTREQLESRAEDAGRPSTASTRARRSSSTRPTQVPFPNKITLFRLPLEEDFPDPERARATRCAGPCVHELAHHAGIERGPIARARLRLSRAVSRRRSSMKRRAARERSTLPPEAMTHTVSPSCSGTRPGKDRARAAVARRLQQLLHPLQGEPHPARDGRLVDEHHRRRRGAGEGMVQGPRTARPARRRSRSAAPCTGSPAASPG